MDKKIKEILEIWHKHFEDETNRYTEFESSDIEYFVGCMLYNHFNFSKALKTMQTIDLSYDFLSNCGEKNYDDVLSLISSVTFDDELKSLEFLQNYIKDAKSRYSDDELYLLNRLEYHVESMAKRYENNIEAKPVEFVPPKKRSANPLER